MLSVTISSKRQITIPAEVFRLLELKEGQKLMVEVEGDRINTVCANTQPLY